MGAADELNAFAANTLLRSSVLTASTTVYLLDDSPGVTRQERQRRAALAAVTDFRDAVRYHDVIQPMADGLGKVAAHTYRRTRVALVERLTRAEETATAKGATASQLRSGLQSYRCVQVAAGLLSRDTQDPLHITTGLMHIWQQGSAYAHGRMWQVVQRSASPEARESQELTMTVTASFSDLTMGVQAAALVLNEAWRMWDLRRVNHLAA